MSKNRLPNGSQQSLLDADAELKAAADKYQESDGADAIDSLRRAAIAFADAWRACEAGKGRP